jgi:hypothetical protein
MLGTRKTTYDGYGILKLPTATFNNTIRLQIIDSATINSILYLITIHDWIDVDQKRSVFSHIDTYIPAYLYRYKQVLHYQKQTVPTAMADPGLKKTVVMVPNPFQSRALIRVTGVKQASLVLTDLLGKIVSAHQNLTEGETTVSFESLQPGIYFYTLIENGAAVTTGKIVAE